MSNPQSSTNNQQSNETPKNEVEKSTDATLQTANPPQQAPSQDSPQSDKSTAASETSPSPDDHNSGNNAQTLRIFHLNIILLAIWLGLLAIYISRTSQDGNLLQTGLALLGTYITIIIFVANSNDNKDTHIFRRLIYRGIIKRWFCVLSIAVSVITSYAIVYDINNDFHLVIIAKRNVNVKDAVIGGIQKMLLLEGSSLPVIAALEDYSWYWVELENNNRGWVEGNYVELVGDRPSLKFVVLTSTLTPTPTSTDTSTPTATNTPTDQPSNTPTPTPTYTSTTTPPPSDTPTPTVTNTASITPIPSATPTATAPPDMIRVAGRDRAFYIHIQAVQPQTIQAFATAQPAIYTQIPGVQPALSISLDITPYKSAIWQQAAAYCQIYLQNLYGNSGLIVDLPTQAEWEAAEQSIHIIEGLIEWLTWGEKSTYPTSQPPPLVQSTYPIVRVENGISIFDTLSPTPPNRPVGFRCVARP